MNKSKKMLLILIGAVILGILWRLLYLWQFSASPLFSHPAGPDVAEYDQWARQIIGGQWLWHTVHIHAPLYPYFLAFLYWLTGYDFFWIRFIQLLIGMAGAVPVYFELCRGQWRRPGAAALIFGGIVLVYPPLIYYQAELTSEVLLLPLLALSWFLLRRQYFLGGGLVAGLAAIAHPGTLVFIAGEILMLAIIPRWKPRPALMFLAGCLIFIAPVVGYNSYLEGHFVPIQKNGGLNFYLGNNVEANGTCNLRPGPEWEYLTRVTSEEAKKSGCSMDRIYTRNALRFIGDHPVTFVRLCLRKAVLVWNWRELIAGADAEPIRYFTAFQRYTSWSFMVVGILGLSGFVCMLACWRKLIEYRHTAWWLVSFWLLQVITVTSGRYRVAMLYPIFIFAALLFGEFVRRKRFRPVLLTLVVLTAALVVIYPRAPYRARAEQAEAASIFGESCYAAGDYEKATKCVRFALEHGNNDAGGNNMLGVLNMDSDPGYAEACFQKAIEADPTLAEGYMNMAILKTRKGELSAAEDYFKIASENYAGRLDLLFYNRGYFREAGGDIDKALADYLAAIKSNPGNRQALNAAGIVYFKKQEMNKARKYFTLALGLDPENTGIMLNLAVIAAISGDREGALRWADRVREIAPDEPKLRAFLDMLK